MIEIWLTLPAPTVIDLMDAVVRASNSLIVFELRNRGNGAPTMTEGAWDRLVEADYLMNSVQDSIYEHTLGTNVYGEQVEP